MTNLMLSRVAFTLFGRNIYWYGIIITCAIILAFVLAFVLAKRRKLSSNRPYEILIAILPLGILSARLFSVIFEPGLTIADYFDFAGGGMSIIGAIIGGFVGIVILCLVRKHNFFEVADLLVVVLILAQGIGRWGNYFNGEVYGQLVTNPALQHLPFAVEIDGAYYEALFFYECMLDLLGFAWLMCMFWFVKQKGWCVASYLVYYGTIRAILETRRQAEYVLKFGSVAVSQLMCFVMIAAGVIIFTYLIVKNIKSKRSAK
ncbi:MAG: prolipoprotein diacylglyceryl transferase [Clostridia bacterium]|nr:prolipoprotein diacylglyceryl transferase [Clostridia bacterium]